MEIQLVTEFSLKLISNLKHKFSKPSVTYVHVQDIFLWDFIFNSCNYCPWNKFSKYKMIYTCIVQ